MALLVRPLPFTPQPNTNMDGYPNTHLALDEPSLIWRGTDASIFIINADLGSQKAIDTVALISHNLPAGNPITVRFSNDDFVTTLRSEYLTIQTGAPPEGVSAKFIAMFAPITCRYIRISVGKDGTGLSYMEAQRLVIGKSLPFGSQAGVEIGAELQFIDQSIAYAGAGWESFDEYPVLPQWKVAMTFIEAAEFAASWQGFFQMVGRKKGVLFAPQIEDPSAWQTQAVFGRIKSDASASMQSTGTRRVELTIRALAP